MKLRVKQPGIKSILGCVSGLGSFGIITLFMVINFSCIPSQSTISVVASQAEKPIWVDVLPRSQEKIYFQGNSSYSNSLAEGVDIARKDAFTKISEYLGISIESCFESHASHSGSHAYSQIRSVSESTIVGAVLEDTYHIKSVRQAGALHVEKFDVYVLFSYSKSRAKKEVSRREQDKKERIISAYHLLKKGHCYENAEKYRSAMGAYMKAQELLKGLELAIEMESEKLDSRLLCANISRRMDIVREVNSRISVSVRVQGDIEKKGVFMANFLSALTQQGFSVTKSNPCYQVVADISTSEVGYTMNNYVYLASGKVSAVQLSLNREIATVVVSSKGFHKTKEQSTFNALEEAGLSVGKEISERIKQSNLIIFGYK